MKPFDLPDNYLDMLRSHFCQPAEMRAAYISAPLDDADREQHHVPEGLTLTPGPATAQADVAGPVVV
jgi:hypothetical protein